MPLRKDNTGTLPYAFEPNSTINYSRGWKLQSVRHRRVNNFGFISDQDYAVQDPRPLIAIVGDSFIEAMQVDYADTAEAQLNRMLGNKARVYSFGAAFAPLSQYLAWSGYVSSTFYPRLLVVNVVGNDFDESVLQLQRLGRGGSTPGMNFFALNDALGDLVRVPFYEEGLGISLLRKSALASYLVRNINITDLRDIREFGKRISAKESRPAVFVGNTAAQADAERLRLSKLAVDFFLDQLPVTTGMPSRDIVISIDGERPEVYGATLQTGQAESYFTIMRNYLINRAQRRGHTIIDLRKCFIVDYKRNHRKFEFPDDGHWNVEGHRVLSESLYDLAQVKDLLGQR